MSGESSTCLKNIVLDEEAYHLLRRMLSAPVIVSSLTVAELQSLCNLRTQVGLPEMPEIDDHFIKRYTNCFMGCEG